jgi:hypothetical protein
MPDMTPEQLMEELKDAGFEVTPLSGRRNWFIADLSHNGLITHTLDIPPLISGTWEFHLARAQPFLKSHRNDKALELHKAVHWYSTKDGIRSGALPTFCEACTDTSGTMTENSKLVLHPCDTYKVLTGQETA